MRPILFSLPVVLVLVLAAPPPQEDRPLPERKVRKKKKNEDKEPVTQTLPVLKDPPPAISAEPGRLTHQVSPLSNKGLLSQQTRDALKALSRSNNGGTIVKLRAFVAGTGDMRRVQSIVSEIFTDKKQPLPALSTIQVGALPMEGAQVVIEGVSMDKKPVNPKGVAFFSGARAADPAGAVSKLDAAARDAQVAANDMQRVTCFLTSLDQVQGARAAVSRAFPMAAADFVQPLRLNADTSAVCEGAGRRGDAGAAIQFTRPAEHPEAVLVRTPKIVFSGTQMAFRDQESDLQLAFDRLGKALEPLGVSFHDVIYSSIYPLTRSIQQKTLALMPQFLAPDVHPAGTELLFEGLPSLDATVAMEVIAAPRQ
jgi:enamine deaminase RidA (YjgF/YER057c/UK114 family)